MMNTPRETNRAKEPAKTITAGGGTPGRRTTAPDPAAENTAKKQRGRPFEKGRSGNPAGRPRGSRNAATLAAAALLDGEAEALTRKAIALAHSGDRVALRLCLERLIPQSRERTVNFELPRMKTADDAAQAIAALVWAVANGDLTPAEASEISKVVDAFTRAIEASNLAERKNLEKSKEARPFVIRVAKGLDEL